MLFRYLHQLQWGSTPELAAPLCLSGGTPIGHVLVYRDGVRI
jgi:hypothetical protein